MAFAVMVVLPWRRASRAVGIAAMSLVLAATIPWASAAAAQEPVIPSTQPLVGRVVLNEAPVVGSPVSLHRVSSEESGPVATAITDSTGSFSFPRVSPEGATFTVYFVTAEHQSINFLGPLVRAEEDPQDYVVAVYDTAHALPMPVRIRARHMVMRPELSGAWDVNEIVVISNPTSLALVASDGSPPWEFRIPSGATDFEVGPGDLLPHEIARMDDRVLHLTPVIPGEREVVIRYRLQADATRAIVPIGEPVDSFNLYVLQPSHLTSVNGIETRQMLDLGDERYLQYGGTDLSPESFIELRWSRPGPPVDPVKAAVSLTLVLLAIGIAAAVRNRSRTVP